jgi:hypothetical protein
MARLRIEKPFKEGHVDAFIEGDTRPLWKGFAAGAGYSTPSEKGGSRRFGLTYHAKEGRIGATAQFRWKKGGLVDN